MIDSCVVKSVFFQNFQQNSQVADLHSKIFDTSPLGAKFFQFDAVFGEVWQNRMLAPRLRVGAPTL